MTFSVKGDFRDLERGQDLILVDFLDLVVGLVGLETVGCRLIWVI
jgi:hypothetical protein